MNRHSSRPASPPAHLSPPAVAATVPVSLAAGVMARRGVDSLVVLEDGRACGVLTERDLLRTATRGGPVAGASVADVCSRDVAGLMTPEPVVVGRTTPVAVAARAMVEAGVGSAVVMDDSGVTGVVTGWDIAAASGEGNDPDSATVDDVYIEVSPLSLDDGIERAVELVEATKGRPVPVVSHDQPVGTVHVPLSRPR